MGFSLSQFVAGAAETGQAIGLKSIEADIVAERDRRLQEYQQQNIRLTQEGAVALERDVRQPFQREQQKAGFEHAEKIQGSQFAFTRSENQLMRDFQSTEHRLDRESRERQHSESVAVQRAHLGVAQQQLKLAQEKVTLVPSADGTMQKIGPDGRSMGTLSDINGNPIQGVKDLSAATKEMIGTYKAALAAVERDIQNEMEPAAKQALRDKRDFYVRAVEQLTGFADQKPTGQQGQRPPLSSFGGSQPAKSKAAPSSSDAGDVATGRAPAPVMAPTPENNALEARFQAETREMETGKRKAYSPEVEAYLKKSGDDRAKGNAAFAERERERALLESRIRANN